MHENGDARDLINLLLLHERFGYVVRNQPTTYKRDSAPFFELQSTLEDVLPSTSLYESPIINVSSYPIRKRHLCADKIAWRDQ